MVLPVLALIIGTGVLGSEIDDGTLVHILAKPLSRREILLSKLAVAVGVTARHAGVPLLLAGGSPTAPVRDRAGRRYRVARPRTARCSWRCPWSPAGRC